MYFTTDLNQVGEHLSSLINNVADIRHFCITVKLKKIPGDQMQMKCILKYNRYNLHTNNPVVKKVIPHPKHRAEGSADMQ